MEGGLEAALKACENFDYYNIIIFFVVVFFKIVQATATGDGKCF